MQKIKIQDKKQINLRKSLDKQGKMVYYMSVKLGTGIRGGVPLKAKRPDNPDFSLLMGA